MPLELVSRQRSRRINNEVDSNISQRDTYLNNVESFKKFNSSCYKQNIKSSAELKKIAFFFNNF